eukprot:88583_1
MYSLLFQSLFIAAAFGGADIRDISPPKPLDIIPPKAVYMTLPKLVRMTPLKPNVHKKHKQRRLIGPIPDFWDGQIRTVNNINVVSTVKSWNTYPNALDIASFTIGYMMERIQLPTITNVLSNHPVYVYHCDPTMKTGVNALPKQSQYDYVSELINWEGDISGGRTADQVYGYGGDTGRPTTICDCNLLGGDCSQNAYGSESILVHEFGHTVMELGIENGEPELYQSLTGEILQQYKQNVPESDNKYCASNAHEMWACAVQTWLIGTKRTDTNPGIHHPHAVYQNVPLLHDVLVRVFGYPSSRDNILGLSIVNELSFNERNYYEHNVPLYADLEVSRKWYTINFEYIAGPQTTWDGANTYCESQGAKLASIHSLEQLNAAKDICKRTGNWNCWIGMSLNKVDGVYEWTDDSNTDYGFYNSDGSRPMTGIFPWGDLQPDNHNNQEECIQLWYYHEYRFNDAICSQQSYALCQMYSHPCVENVDSNVNCGYWASMGECDKNPAYMLSYCQTSCDICKHD